jgi:Family of unknown function (DUF6152)
MFLTVWLTRVMGEASMGGPVRHAAFGLAAVAVGMQAVPATAHHSFARFDTSRMVTLEGTVEEFQWTNPHSWLILSVERKGQPQHWAIEMSGPNGLVRQGWRPKTVTPGMPVSLTIHPLRDGTNGGQFMEITLPDGTIMGGIADSSPGGVSDKNP